MPVKYLLGEWVSELPSQFHLGFSFGFFILQLGCFSPNLKIPNYFWFIFVCMLQIRSLSSCCSSFLLSVSLVRYVSLNLSFWCCFVFWIYELGSAFKMESLFSSILWNCACDCDRIQFNIGSNASVGYCVLQCSHTLIIAIWIVSSGQFFQLELFLWDNFFYLNCLFRLIDIIRGLYMFHPSNPPILDLLNIHVLTSHCDGM